MQLIRNDVTSQLQPRHSCRRERQPGARERHSSMKRRLCSDVTSQPSNTKLMASQVLSSYCMTSASQYMRQPEVEVVRENNNVISAMKDLSTIEAIRESMRSTEKQQPCESKHIPKWMLDLDLNLDVTAVDIIPPFEETSYSDDVTFNEQPTVTFIDDDEDDIDLRADYPEPFPNELDTEYEQSIKNPEAMQAAGNTRTVSISPTVSYTPSSSSPDGRRSRSTPRSQNSPRRYQGDKKVLSMQQGGIRSTPMQPTSTKFINQMITFTHVKVHDKKLKKAKPAIDTKMPSTFKIALDRKKLVEERFNGTFSKSYQSSTPRRRPSIRSDTSKLSKREKTR